MSALISFDSPGDFSKTTKFLKAIASKEIYSMLDEYGEMGVELLSSNTPVRTGATAASWRYEKRITPTGISLEWFNSRLSNDGQTPLIFLIISGHGTRTGGYIPPNDFVTPTMQKVFDDAAEAIWKAVTSL